MSYSKQKLSKTRHLSYAKVIVISAISLAGLTACGEDEVTVDGDVLTAENGNVPEIVTDTINKIVDQCNSHDDYPNGECLALLGDNYKGIQSPTPLQVQNITRTLAFTAFIVETTDNAYALAMKAILQNVRVQIVLKEAQRTGAEKRRLLTV